MKLQERNNLIINNLSIVRKLAAIKRKFIPSNITFDELISVGNLALVEIADKYDIDKGVSFESFASKRIKGAMIDYNFRYIHNWGQNTPIDSVMSLNDVSEELVYNQNESFDELIDGLPEEGKQILRWFYIDNLTYLQISNKFRCSKSKVKRMLSAYKSMIRYSLE